VTSFRVYWLDPAGKIKTGEWIEAADDAEARAKAHELCDHATPTVELWHGRRFVARLPCADEAAA
jgi:hypothetical protein